VHFLFNKAKYEALPPQYQAALQAACRTADADMGARYDVKNMQAIRSLVCKGVQLRPLPRDIMDAAYVEAFKYYDELSASNPKWKKIYEPWKAFRGDIFEWFRVAEFTYDSYVYSQQAAGK